MPYSADSWAGLSRDLGRDSVVGKFMISQELAGTHYKDHAEKPFYGASSAS